MPELDLENFSFVGVSGEYNAVDFSIELKLGEPSIMSLTLDADDLNYIKDEHFITAYYLDKKLFTGIPINASVQKDQMTVNFQDKTQAPFAYAGYGTIDGLPDIDLTTGATFDTKTFLEEMFKGTQFTIGYCAGASFQAKKSWLTKTDWIYEVAKSCQYRIKDVEDGRNVYEIGNIEDAVGSADVWITDDNEIWIGLLGCAYREATDDWLANEEFDITDYILNNNNIELNLIKYGSLLLIGGNENESNQSMNQPSMKVFASSELDTKLYQYDFKRRSMFNYSVNKPTFGYGVSQILQNVYGYTTPYPYFYSMINKTSTGPTSTYKSTVPYYDTTGVWYDQTPQSEAIVIDKNIKATGNGPYTIEFIYRRVVSPSSRSSYCPTLPYYYTGAYASPTERHMEGIDIGFGEIDPATGVFVENFLLSIECRSWCNLPASGGGSSNTFGAKSWTGVIINRKTMYMDNNYPLNRNNFDLTMVGYAWADSSSLSPFYGTGAPQIKFVVASDGTFVLYMNGSVLLNSASYTPAITANIKGYPFFRTYMGSNIQYGFNLQQYIRSSVVEYGVTKPFIEGDFYTFDNLTQKPIIFYTDPTIVTYDRAKRVAEYLWSRYNQIAYLDLTIDPLLYLNPNALGLDTGDANEVFTLGGAVNANYMGSDASYRINGININSGGVSLVLQNSKISLLTAIKGMQENLKNINLR